MRTTFQRIRLCGAVAVANLGFIQAIDAELLYGVDAANNLITFDSAAPGVAMSSVPISGLGDESLRGIDLRPATGEVYGFGSANHIFRIDPITGFATALPGTFPAGSGNFAFHIGMDFQWANDRLRIVDGRALAGSNYRVDPDTGRIVLTGNPVSTPLGGIAYGTIFDSPGIPIEYGLIFSSIASSAGEGALAILGGDGGSFSRVGSTGHSISTLSPIGFDISLGSGIAYASFDEAGGETRSGLYQIDLATGTATFLGNTPVDQLVGITAMAVPEPNVLVLLSLGAFAAVACVRRKRADG